MAVPKDKSHPAKLPHLEDPLRRVTQMVQPEIELAHLTQGPESLHPIADQEAELQWYWQLLPLLLYPNPTFNSSLVLEHNQLFMKACQYNDNVNLGSWNAQLF